jgi:hypothetical protein
MPESQSRVTGGLTNDPAGIAGFEPLLVLGPQKHAAAFFLFVAIQVQVGELWRRA